MLWENGRITDLGGFYPGGGGTAFGINETGQIVGVAETADGHRHAVLWENGQIIDLGTVSGDSSDAFDINDAGQIVGSSQTEDGHHAVLWENGQIFILGTLGGTSSEARGINNADQIVGVAETADAPRPHAVLWENRLTRPAASIPEPEPTVPPSNAGDEFLGIWQGENLTLVITRSDSVYIIESDNPTGMLNGTFAGQLTDGRLDIDPPNFGDIVYVPSSDMLLFAGVELYRVGS